MDLLKNGLKTYNTPTYRNSLFFKGPLLYSTTNFVENSDIKRTTTPNLFKNKVKKIILDCQGEGGGVPMANYGEMANCAVVLGPIRHKNLRHNSP